MPQEITLERLRTMLTEDGAQLVEVLPENEYAEEHLPGAVNVSLKKMTRQAVRDLDRSRPVVVYCWDDI